MSEQYLGQYEDEARRAIGEGLLAHLAARDVIAPLPPAPEAEPEGPSVRAGMEAAKEEHQAYIALLAMGAMEAAQANRAAQGGGE
jgi:hypothetical protein